MGIFASSNYAFGTYDDVNNTFTPLGNGGVADVVATDFEPDTTFEVGDTITLPEWGLSATYLAHTSDGWVGLSTQFGAYVLFGNTAVTGPVATIPGPVDAPCFLTGTMIATPDGERPVETLEIGDTILAADGSTRAIRWIGRQSVVSVFADPIRSYPIRIAAGALGEGLPKRDLFLSPDHALLVDNVLIQAGALVNNTSITRVMQPGERFTYYHHRNRRPRPDPGRGRARRNFRR